MRFLLGQIVITANCLAFCERNGINPVYLLVRHANGCWGDLDAEDRAANERAIIHGDRILSAYTMAGSRIYVITEHDRSITTILMSEDY